MMGSIKVYGNCHLGLVQSCQTLESIQHHEFTMAFTDDHFQGLHLLVANYNTVGLDTFLLRIITPLYLIISNRLCLLTIWQFNSNGTLIYHTTGLIKKWSTIFTDTVVTQNSELHVVNYCALLHSNCFHQHMRCSQYLQVCFVTCHMTICINIACTTIIGCAYTSRLT